MRRVGVVFTILLPLVDLAWNLTHLNIGLVDFYGLTLPAHGLVINGAWPATPYFPAGYPLLLVPFGLAGSTLVGGYILSAAGVALALLAVRRIALDFGAGDWALAAVVLAWATAPTRIVAGSPSVDALYTALGLWFLWAAVTIFIGNAHRLPAANTEPSHPSPLVNSDAKAPWWVDADQGAAHENKDAPAVTSSILPDVESSSSVPAGLTFVLLSTAFILPLLRYHALVLIVPVLIVLAFGRYQRTLVAAAAAMLLLAAAFNYGSWFVVFGEPLPSTWPLQVRVGLEDDYHAHYVSTEALWADYPLFAHHARSSSLLADYPVSQVASHWLRTWLRYLRRPELALPLLICAMLLVRRRLPRGAGVLALWMLGYTFSLSIAYYTPRGVLLPALAGLALLVPLAQRITPSRPDAGAAVAALLLLASFIPAGRFARADMAERAQFARKSMDAERTVREQQLDPANVVVGDMRVLRLPSLSNPWTHPYRYAGHTWLDDPAIRDDQLPGYR